jgi:hypothetical protein
MTLSNPQDKSSVDDLSSTLKTLDYFFDAGSPKEHRKDLKKWRYYVINEKQYFNRRGARYLLSVYEDVLQLIGASQLLASVINEKLPVTEEQICQEKKDWLYFPNNLSSKELLNPYKVIDKFFKKISIEKYKELLNEWLHLALSNKAAQETLSAWEIIEVYDNLRNLFSAAWVIHQREKL